MFNFNEGGSYKVEKNEKLNSKLPCYEANWDRGYLGNYILFLFFYNEFSLIIVSQKNKIGQT